MEALSPVRLSSGGGAGMPVVLVVLKENRGEGRGEALPVFIIQTAISLHQPGHEEHSSSDLLLHGCLLTQKNNVSFLKKKIVEDKIQKMCREILLAQKHIKLTAQTGGN